MNEKPKSYRRDNTLEIYRKTDHSEKGGPLLTAYRNKPTATASKESCRKTDELKELFDSLLSSDRIGISP